MELPDAANVGEKDLLEEAYHQIKAAQLVSEFATDLNAAINLFEVALRTGVYFRQLPGFDQICLVVVDAQESLFGMRDRPDRPADVQQFDVDGPDGLLKRLIDVGETVLAPPEDAGQFEPLLGRSNAEQVIAVPLNARRDRVGCLIVAGGSDGSDRDRALDSVRHAAMPLSTAVERIIAFEKSQREATIDPLSKLYNRRFFLDSLDREVRKAKRVDFDLCLLMIDFDHFKSVNDAYGHLAGDHVLAETAATIMQAVRDVDIPACYGGEEFAVILIGCSTDGLPEIAERVRENIEAHVSVEEALPEKRNITVSVGCAKFDPSTMERESFINAADQALYHAKETGRNRVVISGTF